MSADVPVFYWSLSFVSITPSFYVFTRNVFMLTHVVLCPTQEGMVTCRLLSFPPTCPPPPVPCTNIAGPQTCQSSAILTPLVKQEHLGTLLWEWGLRNASESGTHTAQCLPAGLLLRILCSARCSQRQAFFLPACSSPSPFNTHSTKGPVEKQLKLHPV